MVLQRHQRKANAASLSENGLGELQVSQATGRAGI